MRIQNPTWVNMSDLEPMSQTEPSQKRQRDRMEE